MFGKVYNEKHGHVSIATTPMGSWQPWPGRLTTPDPHPHP